MKSVSIVPLKNIGRIVRKAIQDPRFALHSFRRRFLSFLTYKFGSGYSAPPETVSLFLTYRCNLRCSMCGQWGEHGVFKDYTSSALNQHLSHETIRRLLREFKIFKPTITLFGGEPMLYKGWIDIVREAKENAMRCNMVTNAVLLSRYAEDMVKYEMDEIIFSLDGPRDVHDRIRGVAGTFDRAMDGFKLLRDIKFKQGKKKPFVTINATVNNYNYNCLSEIVDIADDVGAYHLNIHHLLFLNKAICERHNNFFKETFGVTSPDWFGFVRDTLPDIDVDTLLKQMRLIKQRQTGVSVSFYPNFTEEEIREYYTGWEFESKSYSNRCLSPWMVAYIFPDGSVVPYHTMNYNMGNVNVSSFMDIWNGVKYRKFRQVVKHIGKFAVCGKGCTELYRY
ncbi:MAG: radical SAM protein [Deltaproteobacteria bacterium]|nr:radical SAM protein [Deltaproteobacteria bacterium]